MFPHTEAQCKHGGTDGSTSCTNIITSIISLNVTLSLTMDGQKINIKSMNINTKATIGHHEHVHHHHHRHHKDDVESFKQQSLRVRKRRKMISQVLFVTLSILAAIIIIACVASNWLF